MNYPTAPVLSTCWKRKADNRRIGNYDIDLEQDGPSAKAWTDFVNHGKEDRDEFLSALPTPGSQILGKIRHRKPQRSHLKKICRGGLV